MPNVWTHILFAEDVADKVGYEVPSDDIKPFLRLGAQGPDPFFYHRFWPWKKDKPVAAIGHKIHNESCGPFLIAMIESGRQTSDFYLQAYILGFVTHHILDRNAHPYINYRSGKKDHKHQRLEVLIDTLLMEELRGIKTWKTPVYKKIDIGKHLYPPIEQMLETLISRFFPQTAKDMPPHYVDESYQDLLKALKALFDPIGWKNKYLHEQVSPYSYQKASDDRDFLNRNHAVWRHPTNDHETHDESFDELLKQAESEGIRILTAILHYWNHGEELYVAIEKELGNISYSTGKDCTLDVENQYFDPIL